LSPEYAGQLWSFSSLPVALHAAPRTSTPTPSHQILFFMAVIIVNLTAEEEFMERLFIGIGLSILLLTPTVSGAQILVAGEGPVVYGHHHLNTTNMAAQKKFYVDTLGGVLVQIGSGDRQQEIIKFPNVLMFFRPMQAPTGGSIGTTVNHIGFSVPDLKPVVAKIKANGYKMITTDSVAANVKE